MRCLVPQSPQTVATFIVPDSEHHWAKPCLFPGVGSSHHSCSGHFLPLQTCLMKLPIPVAVLPGGFQAWQDAAVLVMRIRAVWGCLFHTCGSSQGTVFLLDMESRHSWALEQDRLVQHPVRGSALPLSSAMISLPWCLHLFRSSWRVIQCCRQEAAAVPPLLFELHPASRVKLNLIQNTQKTAVSLEPAAEQLSWFV